MDPNSIKSPVIEDRDREMAGTIVSELLNLDNYKYWRRQVSLYFTSEGLWDSTTLGDKNQCPRGGPKLKAWERSDAKALHTILICCGKKARDFVEDSTTAKQAWETLAQRVLEHRGDDTNNIQIDYQRFFKALADPCDSNVVMGFIEQYQLEVILRVRDPATGWPALHTAVISQNVAIVKELVNLMTVDDLELTDKFGDTALSCCLPTTNRNTDEAVEISKCLVEKNEKLLSIANPRNRRIEVVNAFVNDFPKLFEYLYSVTPLENNVSQAALLICYSLRKEKYDIALELITEDPSLVLADNGDGISPMNELACLPSAFLIRERLKFWEKWIYDGIKIPRTTNVDDEICIDVPRHGICPMTELACMTSAFLTRERLKFWEKWINDDQIMRGTNHLYKKKLKHHQILQILECMGEVTKRIDLDPKQRKFMQTSVFQATERGMGEFIVPLLRANPKISEVRDENARSMFHLAIECRREKIVSLLHGFGDLWKKRLLSRIDDNNNKLLHMMGFVSPFTYSNLIRGAALQMQRELQWFKELESMTTLHNREVVNYTDEMKPRELFTKNHMELVKEGEKSMKDTATSCTVVGALIITMMFTAAFTVPGGNSGETAIPVLLKDKLFKTFIVADAISLCTSTTSVVMFLGILTSRYAEDDFLVSLPRKMILGLSTLFLSIVAMMVAFSSAIFLMLPLPSWIGIFATVLSGVPVATFVWMQFPFLIEILVSTYRPSLFDKKVEKFDKD